MAAPLPHHVQAAMTPHLLEANERSSEEALRKIPFALELIRSGHSLVSIPQFSSPPIWERDIDQLHPYFRNVDTLMSSGSIAFSVCGKEIFFFLKFESPDSEKISRIYHISENATADESAYYQVSRKDSSSETRLCIEKGTQRQATIVNIMKKLIPAKKSSWTSSLKLAGILGAVAVAYFANRFFATQQNSDF